MITEAINKILSLAPASTLEVKGRMYIDGPDGFKPILEPTPKTLIVHTLSGLVDYLDKKIDALKKEPLFIHVVSPTEVSLFTNGFAGCFWERPEYLRVIFDAPAIPKDNYFALEDFIISLQSRFVQTDTTAAILKVVGNVKDENVANFADDGVTQAVTTKAGISTLAVTPVPNPVTLRPFRTFPEIDQPESLFIFRMRQAAGQAPFCGLWEADNKLWKIKAVKDIAEWLQDKLPSIPIIA